MSKYVICKTTGKGVQGFYLYANNKMNFLFERNYRKSNREYYGRGVNLKDAVDFAKTNSPATRMTMERLRKALAKWEKSTGIICSKQGHSKIKYDSRRNKEYRNDQYDAAM